MTVARGGREAGVLRVIVLADDLIWATRLVGQLRTLGVDPVRVGSADAFATALAAPAPAGPEGMRPTHAVVERPTHAVVDLTARAYDGLALAAPPQHALAARPPARQVPGRRARS